MPPLVNTVLSLRNGTSAIHHDDQGKKEDVREVIGYPVGKHSTINNAIPIGTTAQATGLLHPLNVHSFLPSPTNASFSHIKYSTTGDK